eukprot:4269896-Amphidinium_carterae.1
MRCRQSQGVMLRRLVGLRLVSCYESFGAGQASCESFFRTSAAQSHRGHTLDDVVLQSVR